MGAMQGGRRLQAGTSFGGGGSPRPDLAADLSSADLSALQEAVGQYERCHARIGSACEELERLADGLPALPDNGSHLRLARRLGDLLRDAHAQEEGRILPLLSPVFGAEEMARFIATLTEEHRNDEAFADEVSEVLLEWAAGERHHDAATLGYMLRGLFDNLRRHIDRERDHLVIPLAHALSSPTET